MGDVRNVKTDAQKPQTLSTLWQQYSYVTTSDNEIIVKETLTHLEVASNMKKERYVGNCSDG